ncbi:MAG: XRE family transcriptional regulator [Methanomicrobium sp.]|nr:XRE family transcriptional regulator [Methanomicrobium sp.]
MMNQIGERIRAARKGAGLSLRALGDMAGVSQTAISKYEKGEIIPDSGMLITIGKATNTSLDFFFRQNVVKLSSPSYRCKKSLKKKPQSLIHARTVDWLERYLEIEHITNEKIEINLPKKEECHVDSLKDIESIAIKIRRKWNLGLDPIDNLTDTFEMNGIKVGLIDADNKFDALTFLQDNNPVIVVAKNIPGDRQRFNLAHELGHIILDLNPDLDEEKAAHRFAGAFLIPEEMIKYELREKRKALDINELYRLKHRYGISMKALVHRAADLEIIQETVATRLYQEFSKRGWNKKEPGKGFPNERPIHMEMLILRAHAEEKITRSRAVELFGEPLTNILNEYNGPEMING